MRVDLDALVPEGWDTYVESHPAATAYHRSAAVRVGAEAFRLRTYFLSARDGQGRLAGVLPVVEQSSLLFGRFLVSVPFFTYGGVLADSPEATQALATAAADLAGRRGVAHVELRHSEAVPALTLPERLDKVSMVLPLPSSEEALSKQLGSKLRSQIKRAEREQVEVVWGDTQLLSEFYDVFAPAMHRLGTPVYPRRFFEIACRAFGALGRVLIVRSQGQPQAAAIIVRHGRRIEVPWAAATEAAKRGAINMRMYWEMLRYSIAAGAEAFDFGRSTVDSGTYRFKAQWGAAPVQLHWHYWLRKGGELPKLNQSNPKYARAADLWRRMPLWCANLIGPYIIRNLP
ncbi:MAG TPA: FemAB family XrtA/PEP-CTERM system-associated protein [Steroidobacteraceae bacterium]|nr:FemAB family XrtA/PEP-CTERM system-associated protein [Steroidobacteraceae bacterium]